MNLIKQDTSNERGVKLLIVKLVEQALCCVNLMFL